MALGLLGVLVLAGCGTEVTPGAGASGTATCAGPERIDLEKQAQATVLGAVPFSRVADATVTDGCATQGEPRSVIRLRGRTDPLATLRQTPGWSIVPPWFLEREKAQAGVTRPYADGYLVALWTPVGPSAPATPGAVGGTMVVTVVPKDPSITSAP